MRVRTIKGVKYDKGAFHQVEDFLSVEQSLKVSVNNTPFTVTMQTPGNEQELVRGLLFTERVYSEINSDPIVTVKEKSDQLYISSVDVVIEESTIGKGFETTRSLVSVSSCGICGKTDLDDVAVPTHNKVLKSPINPKNIERMFERMSLMQDTFIRSGGSHASAAFTHGGEMLTIQEDIGRHNAVDKVIGSLLLTRELSEAVCMIVSGRVSYEIVNKCSIAGIPVLAAVSAPSTMAVELAEKLGVTLLAFCREDRFTVYSQPSRIETANKLKMDFVNKKTVNF